MDNLTFLHIMEDKFNCFKIGLYSTRSSYICILGPSKLLQLARNNNYTFLKIYFKGENGEQIEKNVVFLTLFDLLKGDL